jgi:cobalt/nickel transport system permease protein
MQPLAMDRWSRGASWLHRRDARAKLAILLGLLIAISTTSPASQSFQLSLLFYATVVMLGTALARLPFAALLLRAAWVLPFSLTFAGLVYWSGDSSRAIAMIEKSYLSACTTLLFVATTPVEEWTAALEHWHVPPALVLVVQFLYRYLFVIVDQAHRMRQASSLRRGVSRGLFKKPNAQGTLLEGAAGAVGVLFAVSWKRAGGVHQAMSARGFKGSFPAAGSSAFLAVDAVFLAVGLTLLAALRIFTI